MEFLHNQSAFFVKPACNRPEDKTIRKHALRDENLNSHLGLLWWVNLAVSDCVLQLQHVVVAKSRQTWAEPPDIVRALSEWEGRLNANWLRTQNGRPWWLLVRRQSSYNGTIVPTNFWFLRVSIHSSIGNWCLSTLLYRIKQSFLLGQPCSSLVNTLLYGIKQSFLPGQPCSSLALPWRCSFPCRMQIGWELPSEQNKWESNRVKGVLNLELFTSTR